MKTLTNRMREETGREETKILQVEIRKRALDMGIDQTSPRVIFLPMQTPKCVPDSFNVRSGQGEDNNSVRIASHLDGGAEVTTADFALFKPKPETAEKVEIMLRAGKTCEMREETMAKSSAKAKDLMPSTEER